MAFPEDLMAPTARNKTTTVERTVEPTFYPVTVDDVKVALRITDSNELDAEIEDLIPPLTRIVENRTRRTLIETQWKQTMDSVSRLVTLRRRPVLQVDSIKIIANFEADTEVLVPASSYILSGCQILARSSWSSHRAWQSFIVRFRTGYYLLPSPQVPETPATARAAVPTDLKLAICQWVGHFLENTEGQGPEVKYQAMAEAQTGATPPNVQLILDAYMDWSLR